MQIELTLPQIKALITVANEGLADMDMRMVDQHSHKAEWRTYDCAARAIEKLKKVRSEH